MTAEPSLECVLVSRHRALPVCRCLLSASLWLSSGATLLYSNLIGYCSCPMVLSLPCGPCLAEQNCTLSRCRSMMAISCCCWLLYRPVSDQPASSALPIDEGLLLKFQAMGLRRTQQLGARDHRRLDGGRQCCCRVRQASAGQQPQACQLAR